METFNDKDDINFCLIVCIFGSSMPAYELMAYFLLATNNTQVGRDTNLFIHSSSESFW